MLNLLFTKEGELGVLYIAKIHIWIILIQIRQYKNYLMILVGQECIIMFILIVVVWEVKEELFNKDIVHYHNYMIV